MSFTKRLQAKCRSSVVRSVIDSIVLKDGSAYALGQGYAKNPDADAKLNDCTERVVAIMYNGMSEPLAVVNIFTAGKNGDINMRITVPVSEVVQDVYINRNEYELFLQENWGKDFHLTLDIAE